MSPWEAFRLALRSLALHKLRSVLTTLGIIFGVGAVISMLAISEGARLEALEQIEALGVKNIRLRSVQPPQQEKPQGRQFVIKYGATVKGLEHLASVEPAVRVAVPLRDLRQPVWVEGKKSDFHVVATTPKYLAASDQTVAEGRFLSALDEREKKVVCVLGAEARRKLFRQKEALGQTVKFAGRYFRVVGVMADRSKSAAIQSRDVNNDIYVPYETFRARLGATTMTYEMGKFETVSIEVDEAILALSGVDRVVETVPLVRRVLERLHPKNDVEMIVPLELLQQREATQRVFRLVMLSIAAISLVVGGIGIMNIMLASVVERTREIGTRRALGARKRDILVQFLIEALVLALIGGLLGIGFGLGTAAAIAKIAGWRMATTAVGIVLAFVVAGVTGVVAGTYPAWKAAQSDPIESLRSE